MNKVILMGRLTRDPEMRYGGSSNTGISRFSIAVDRRFKREGQPEADFFNCVAFGRLAEFTEKYLHKGTKILLEGEVQNDNYTNKEGRMVYGFQIVANNIEFAESKSVAEANGSYVPPSQGGGFSPSSGAGGGSGLDLDDDDDFMKIEDDIGEEGMLFDD